MVSRPVPGDALLREPDAPLHRVPEAVIHEVWRRRLFDPQNLRTTSGEPVWVLDPGTLNRASGPDFSGARLRIDDLVWVGDVEIHRTSAEWTRHRHHEDPAYDRVVLHVIVSPDAATGTLARADGTPLPELALLPHLDRSLRALLHDVYVARPSEPPYCAGQWEAVPESTRRAMVRRAGHERLAARAERLGRAYGQRPDLDHLLVRAVFRALGYAPNADAMERLATRLPRERLRTLDATDLRIALLGLAGLLDDRLFDGDGAARFRDLADSLTLLPPMRPEAWRHGGRPANAPRQRIAQAAALLSEHDGASGWLRHDAFGKALHAVQSSQPVEALRAQIRAQVTPEVRPVGEARTDDIVRNAILPVVMLHAQIEEDPELERRAVALVEGLRPESNRVTRAFAEAGLEAEDALDSQGVHQLAEAYCEEGRCDRCAIGRALAPALAV